MDPGLVSHSKVNDIIYSISSFNISKHLWSRKHFFLKIVGNQSRVKSSRPFNLGNIT